MQLVGKCALGKNNKVASSWMLKDNFLQQNGFNGMSEYDPYCPFY